MWTCTQRSLVAVDSFVGSRRLFYLGYLSPPRISLPTRYYCEKCRRIAKKGPTCAACEGAMTRHNLKMTRFRLVSWVCWTLAIFLLFWPFLAPPELLAFFYLAFLFVAVAVAMEWFDARLIAIRVIRAVRESKGPHSGPR